MKIRIRINKIDALRAGQDKHGLFVVDVPAAELSELQRAELAHPDHECASRYYEQPVADFYLAKGDYMSRDEKVFAGISEANPEAVKTAIDRLIAMRAAKAAEDVAKEAERAAREVQAQTHSAMARAKYAQEAAEREAKRLEVERREVEAMQTLHDWSADNGSELLKARIAEGFDWLGLAEREYADSVLAPLGEELETPEHDSVKFSPRTTPTLGEIQRLREVRELLTGQPVKVELLWVEYTTDADGYEVEDRVQKRAEINVTVTCPTGRELDDYFYNAEPIEVTSGS